MQDSTTTSDPSAARDPRDVRRNFTLLTMDAGFYWFAMAFFDPTTVLPAFLSTLTKNSIIIGLVATIRPAFQYIPQLWTAHYLRNRVRHKSYLIKGAAIARVGAILFALVLFASSPSSKALMLWAFVGMYAAFWFSEGIVIVSWTDLVAKCIPERLRGRLFGTMQFSSGILASLAGLVVYRMLSKDGPAYPMNYAVLAAFAAFFYTASLTSLSFVKEPDGTPEEFDGGFLHYVKQMAGMLRGHSQLLRVIAVQLLLGVFGMAMIFFMIYARKSAHIDRGTVGLLLIVQVIGSTLVSAAVGYISDHRHPKAAIVFSAGIGLLAPVLCLFAGRTLWVYGIVFFAVGGMIGSSWIGINNFVLELAQPQERKAYIGLMNTANAPTLIFPLLGGVIVRLVSYEAMFALTAAAFIAAIILALGLDSRKTAVSR